MSNKPSPPESRLEAAVGAEQLLWVSLLAQEALVEQVADVSKCEINKPPQEITEAPINQGVEKKLLWVWVVFFFFPVLFVCFCFSWLLRVSGRLTQTSLCLQMAALLGEAKPPQTMHALLLRAGGKEMEHHGHRATAHKGIQ